MFTTVDPVQTVDIVMTLMTRLGAVEARLLLEEVTPTDRAILVEKVKRCWASLWTGRAISCRARKAITPDAVSLAVVVQVLVPADAAGVMFTADPVSGNAGQIVINAAWGVGEAVVAGQVSPDTVVAATGTHDEPVPAEQRHQAVLNVDEVADLARLGIRVETLYGQPMDVEWARSRGRFWILQCEYFGEDRSGAIPNGKKR